MSIRQILARLLGATPAPQADEPSPRLLDFSTHNLGGGAQVLAAVNDRLARSAPQMTKAGQAMDGSGDFAARVKSLDTPTIGEALFSWYGSQSFIGHQLAAIIAQHWLVDKACSMPARDAIRQGFAVALEGRPTEAEELTAIKKAHKRFGVNKQMQEFVRMGRVFGIRIAIFKVKSDDPKYYELPFNIDAVTAGSFEGIVQVDPYWCAPQLNAAASGDPASAEFYEPTFWMIGGKKYHRSHLAIFRTSQPADMLKPSYLYGGIPVPQQIMERVYAAERTANEAPQLAMTKRLTVWNTDLTQLLANQDKFSRHMTNFINFRDNYGVKINDTDDTMQQFDTSLADLDDVIMTQYQIVAAAAKVPATKLLGTTPKGFNATGEYEESSYHEELETIQENDLTPFLDRYLEILMRSEIEPKHGHAPGALNPVVKWEPLDSPTAEELANTNKTKAETDNLYVTMGAIDGEDVRERIKTERDSGYTGLTDRVEGMGDPLNDAIAALGGGDDPLEAATAALGGGGAEPLDEAVAALQTYG